MPRSSRSPRAYLYSHVILSLAIALALTACDDVAVYSPTAEIVAEPVASDMSGETSDAARPGVRKHVSTTPRGRANVLTAGDIDDTLNPRDFKRFLMQASAETNLPKTKLGTPIAVQIVNRNTALPAPGLRVTLSHRGETFYDGYSGVEGRLTVFPATRGAKSVDRSTLKVFGPETGQLLASQIVRTGGGRQRIEITAPGEWDPQFLDIGFVVDTTGSMGDELAWLTKDLSSIIRQARAHAPGVNIRYGLVLYRDQGDQYVVRNMGFTDDLNQMRRFLRQQRANGGGDYPEAAAEALESAVALNWRRGQGERLLFHIADAPPHSHDAARYLHAAQAGAAKNIHIFGLGASGVAVESEYLMRQASAMTEGRYLFLTDDSGVGNSHGEPTTSCYLVTQLSDLMTRVIGSELSGRRIEPDANRVIRRVGSYDRGVCQT